MIFEDRTHNKKSFLSVKFYNPKDYAIHIEECERERHFFRKDKWRRVKQYDYASWERVGDIIFKRHILPKTLWEVTR